MSAARGFALAAVLALSVAAAGATEVPAGGHRGHSHDAGHLDKVWARMLANKQALTVAARFDARGRLWLARVDQGHVEVLFSDDRGAQFSAPVRVNPEAQHIAANGDGRPKIVLADDGGVLVSWTENLSSPPFATHVWLARSDDGGRSFAVPVRVNDDDRPISHAFEEIHAGADGRVWAVWLDRRAHADAKGRGEHYAGTALYYAVSTDGGRSFAANRKLADHVCECCRLALVPDQDGVPLVMWRHIFEGGIRDHALARLDSGADVAVQIHRATADDWQVEACPHHGPSMATGRDGAEAVVHLAWFTGGERAGLHYRRGRGDGSAFEPSMAIGDGARQPGHPQVLALGERVFLAWKEFDGERSHIRTMTSTDAGASWSAARTVATTNERSDHPLLIANGTRAFLSWNTAREGYRLIDLGVQGEGQ